MGIQSHEHGAGKNRKTVWGAKEDCERCVREEELLAEARKDWAVRFQPMLDKQREEQEGVCETST